MTRSGIGFDSHRLAVGRRLVIGGVAIPHPYGLVGHSDADVLAHAVIDALFGAVAAGDIGAHFPDDDPKWDGADSMELLAAAFLKAIRDAEDELAALRANPFFRGVGSWEGFKQVSLVLQQGLGYSDILRIYGVLEAMYSLSEGIYRLETKDIAQLYEIWCFIEVKNRVAAILDVPPKEVKHKNRGELGEMFGSEMRTGRRSRIPIEKGDTRLELFYNPKTTEADGSGIDKTEAPNGGAQNPDIVAKFGDCPFETRGEQCHVWRGELANEDPWIRRFGEEL